MQPRLQDLKENIAKIHMQHLNSFCCIKVEICACRCPWSRTHIHQPREVNTGDISAHPENQSTGNSTIPPGRGKRSLLSFLHLNALFAAQTSPRLSWCVKQSPKACGEQERDCPGRTSQFFSCKHKCTP